METWLSHRFARSYRLDRVPEPTVTMASERFVLQEAQAPCQQSL
jgi:hypothetical protein